MSSKEQSQCLVVEQRLRSLLNTSQSHRCVYSLSVLFQGVSKGVGDVGGEGVAEGAVKVGEVGIVDESAGAGDEDVADGSVGAGDAVRIKLFAL